MQRPTADIKSHITAMKEQQKRLSEIFRQCASETGSQTLKLLGNNNKLIAFVKEAMSYWKGSSFCMQRSS
jgi:hypothetical protein